MFVLLGASGYVGQAFAQELQRTDHRFIALSRKELDYTRFNVLLPWLQKHRPGFLINAAGYTGKPNVDACENDRANTIQGNTLFPQMLAHACAVARIPWGQIASGCIYSGAKITAEAGDRVEKDLMRPEVQSIVREQPERIKGFTERDTPNFSFRDDPCSFYSGTKALAEEAIFGIGQSYIWRLRIPFDGLDHPRNYLTKVQRYAKVYDNVNSLSHRSDFANACLQLWERRAPFGIYNVTNPGFVTTRDVIKMIERILKPNRRFEFWKNDAEFYETGASTPRSNCVLDVSKLLSSGVKMRPVEEALEASLRMWQ